MKLHKISARVALPINTANKEFVPDAIDFQDHRQLLEHVATAVNTNMPVMLIGETGTGKTSLVRYLAQKTNNGFRRVNHNGATSVDDIVGKILVNKEGTYWVDGVLIEAMRNGYWYLADEINATSAEINFAYHSLLDDDAYIVLPENRGEIVRPHPNFRFFATMNPAADYVGVKQVNKALLSRFIVVKLDFSPPATEAKILMSRTGIEKDKADRMIRFAAEIRANYSKQKLAYVLSTRDLLMWATLYRRYRKYIVSAELAVLNKVGQEDFESVKDLLALHFRNLDEPKTKAKVTAGTVKKMYVPSLRQANSVGATTAGTP